MTTNQASGGDSVPSARSHGWRQRDREMLRLRPAPAGAGLNSVVSELADTQDVICVHAETQSWNGTQSLLPLPHCASGVFQNLIVLK